ncbi:GSCOCG00010484001-RA-CDS [Cotesia congregata]|nr:GSCOCG00010484001-RA-CDS [Cotesia congregata]
MSSVRVSRVVVHRRVSEFPASSDWTTAPRGSDTRANSEPGAPWPENTCSACSCRSAGTVNACNAGACFTARSFLGTKVLAEHQIHCEHTLCSMRNLSNAQKKIPFT